MPTASTATVSSPRATADPIVDSQVDEWLLVSRYDATIARHPDLESQLAPFRDQHVAHATALGSTRPDPLPDTGTAPKSPVRALALLAAAEQTARGLRIDACVRCSEPALATTLALIAASEASHATALETLQ